MGRSFEQFVRFTTDAAGLERLFRLLQATTQILTSYTFPFTCLLILLEFIPTTSTSSSSSTSSSVSEKAATAAGNGATSPSVDAATVYAILLALKGNLALARRYFRLFRFLESFNAAQKLLSSLPSSSSSRPGKKSFLARTQAEVYLDIFSRTFNGMYLLLEATTLMDAQNIPGLSPWGKDLEKAVNIEGQRFWLFSLVCSALAGIVKIGKVVALTPLPAPSSSSSPSAAGTGSGTGDVGVDAPLPSDPETEKEKTRESEEVDGNENENENEEKFDLKKEQARLRAIVQDQRSRRRAWIKEVRSQVSVLARRVLSDALDTLIPGSIVGWIPAGSGPVGLAMFVTTVLTSKDIWDRCGREVAGAAGKK